MVRWKKNIRTFPTFGKSVCQEGKDMILKG